MLADPATALFPPNLAGKSYLLNSILFATTTPASQDQNPVSNDMEGFANLDPVTQKTVDVSGWLKAWQVTTPKI